MKMSDKAIWSVAHNKKKILLLYSNPWKEAVWPWQCFTSNYIFLHLWTQCQTIWTTPLDRMKFIAIRNLNIVSNFLVKRNNCEIPILAWTISYYYRQKKQWVYWSSRQCPSFWNNVVLFNFCDIISSTYISNERQHTKKSSHQYHCFGWNQWYVVFMQGIHYLYHNLVHHHCSVFLEQKADTITCMYITHLYY